MVRVTLFKEQLLFWVCCEELVPVSEWLDFIENADCFGSGSSMVSLLSIESTVEMDGLSFGSSWTHNNPICMHLTTSDR